MAQRMTQTDWPVLAEIGSRDDGAARLATGEFCNDGYTQQGNDPESDDKLAFHVAVLIRYISLTTAQMP